MMGSSIDPGIEIDNDEPAHRQALTEALRAEGLDAYEYHSGGGCMHVVVDLVSEDGGENLLQIATGSVASQCDVALMGWNEHSNVQSNDWIRALTLRDAVVAFKRYWSEQEALVDRFRRGEMNL
jgi:hypothetical protein